MKTKLHKSEFEAVGHFDLHRECWKGGKLIAVLFTSIKTETTKIYHTSAYNNQFDGYFKDARSLDLDKFIFHLVSKKTILKIYSETRTAAEKADLAVKEFNATGVLTGSGLDSAEERRPTLYAVPYKFH